MAFDLAKFFTTLRTDPSFFDKLANSPFDPDIILNSGTGLQATDSGIGLQAPPITVGQPGVGPRMALEFGGQQGLTMPDVAPTLGTARASRAPLDPKMMGAMGVEAMQAGIGNAPPLRDSPMLRYGSNQQVKQQPYATGPARRKPSLGELLAGG